VRKLFCSRWLWLVLISLSISATSFAQVGITVSFGPPALPVYTQPLCPAPGYIWTPGYWAWDPNYGDYYWVPGTWVLAPQVGYLWTPPWWGWSGAAFIFHQGFWGPTIGFYGGINYGFGYFGHGYDGGRWNGNQFYYNRTVNNINVTNVRNYYNVTVVNNNPSRVAYNGGQGGIVASPNAAEQAAERERHIAPVEAQTRQVQEASQNQQLRASVNKGKPPIAATPKAGTLTGAGIVRAKSAGAPYHPPAKAATPEANGKPVPRPPTETAHPANESAATRENNEPTPVHARNLPTHSTPAPSAPANTEAEKQYQQRQQQLSAQENAEHEKLAQQQEQDHERMAQQHASNAQMQEMERQHQQQTQQLQQQHEQQERQLSRQAPPAPHNEAPRGGQPEKR